MKLLTTKSKALSVSTTRPSTKASQSLLSPGLSTAQLHNSNFANFIQQVTTMPRPETNLNPYKDEIIRLCQDASSTEDIASHLLANYNLHVSVPTLKRRLSLWGITRRVRTDDSSQLRARISTLFFEW